MKSKKLTILFYKIILIFSVFIIINNIIIINSYSASSDFTYKLFGDEAIITGYNGSEENLTIPSMIDEHPVRGIDLHAFDGSRNENATQITNVTISEGIIEVGNYAFMACPNLKSVKLPETLEYLGMYAFIQDKNLDEINVMPSRVKEISEAAFCQTGFTEFIIPEHIEIIRSMAFRSCKNLKKVKVYSRDVQYEGDQMFQYSNNELVLYGYPDSTTQEYAISHNIPFKDITVEEKDIPVDKIELDKSSIQLNIGENRTIEAIITPDNATNKAVNWETSNINVATVENGIVRAVGAGTTTITATTEDGNKQSTCRIIVTNEQNKNETINRPTNQTINTIKEPSRTNTSSLIKITNNNSSNNTNTSHNKIPNAGNKNIVIIVLIILTIISVIFYKRYRYYNCIK